MTRAIAIKHPLWCRDLVSCLQSTFATVIEHAGQDALEVLGAGFAFRYRPGHVTPEEFYYPTGSDDDLGRSLAPHHDLTATWWQPTDDTLAQVSSRLEQRRLVIAAVDNFHLPYRPAFHDVHAAHLLVIRGLDERRGLVDISDAMPPEFFGSISIDDFVRSWSSPNPQDVQDAFFSAAPIGRRCVDVTLGGPYPPLTPPSLARMIRANLEGFAAPMAEHWTGGEGIRAFTDDLVRRCKAGDRRVLRELYPFGWAMQAQAGLHGELLRTRGAAWHLPRLAEAGRAVESVAHAWTGLRMTGAHGRDDPATAAGHIALHAAVLTRRYAEAIEALQVAVAAL